MKSHALGNCNLDCNITSNMVGLLIFKEEGCPSVYYRVVCSFFVMGCLYIRCLVNSTRNHMSVCSTECLLQECLSISIEEVITRFLTMNYFQNFHEEGHCDKYACSWCPLFHSTTCNPYTTPLAYSDGM